MNYADPFSVQENTPLSRTLQLISLQADKQLFWPSGYAGVDYLGSINQIAPTANGFSLRLPDATQASIGTGFLVVNTGGFSFTLRNFAGDQLTTVDPGMSKYVYNTNNTTLGGTWRTTLFGQGTSSADAALLSGNGIVEINGTLNAAYPISTSSSDVNITSNDRAKIYIASAGSVTLNVPNHNTLGNNFFFGAHNGGSGTLLIQPVTGDTVDGYTSLSLAPNESVFVFCSGSTQFYTIGYGRSTQFQFTKLVKDITAGGTIALTSAEASNKLMQFIGTPTANIVVNVPSVVGIYYVQNSYSGSYSLTIKTIAGSGVVLGAGDRAILYCDGTNVVSAQSVAVGANISVVDGTLSAPSINFASDTNTGFYHADLETMGVVSNGVEAVRFAFDKSAVIGKLGVGTAVPAVQLHVNAGVAEAFRIQGTGAYQTFYDTAGIVRFSYTSGQAGELRDWVDGVGIRSFYINSTARLTVTAAGITVNGAVTASNLSGSNTGDQNLAPYALNSTLASYAILTGGNTFVGVQVIPAQRSSVVALGNVSGSKNIDLATGSTFTATITGATTFTFSNAPPSGQDQTVYLKLTNAGAQVGFVAGTKFPNGVAAGAALTAAGRDLLAVWYDSELTSYVVGVVWKDYK